MAANSHVLQQQHVKHKECHTLCQWASWGPVSRWFTNSTRSKQTVASNSQEQAEQHCFEAQASPAAYTYSAGWPLLTIRAQARVQMYTGVKGWSPMPSISTCTGGGMHTSCTAWQVPCWGTMPFTAAAQRPHTNCPAVPSASMHDIIYGVEAADWQIIPCVAHVFSRASQLTCVSASSNSTTPPRGSRHDNSQAQRCVAVSPQ